MSPAQTTGTPALNPPPAKDPASLADTPQGVDRYDVLIGGSGFMLYRDKPDNDQPSEHFQSYGDDLTYSPVFIDRSNVQGDLGDNVQDFFMTFVQRDWSGGMGQKYFRQQADRERSFWDCKNVDCTTTPGSVRVGADTIKAALSTGSSPNGLYCNMVYFKNSGGGTVGPVEGMVKVEGAAATTVVAYYSVDATNWTLQTTSGAPLMVDCVDMMTGDDGFIYCLEGTNGTTSTIHRLAAPATGATLAWDNTTKVTGGYCTLITFWGGNIYVADRNAKLKQVAFGTSAVQSIIHDFGAGKIVDMLPTPAGIYILYVTNMGDYRLFRYDGASTTELARMPMGWHLQIPHETFFTAEGAVAAQNSVHCMTSVDGVLYVTGLIPARDYVQSNRNSTNYRQALWFYASGNSGIIWASEVLNNSHYRASGGAICQVRGGAVVWLDGTDDRIMQYDPATGGVSCIGQFISSSGALYPHGASLPTVSGTINSAATTLVISGASALPPNGAVLTTSGSTEKALVVGGGGTTTLTIFRGYQDTTPANATFTNGLTVNIDAPMPAPHRLAYDVVNNAIFIVWYPSGPGGYGSADRWENRIDKIVMRPGPGYAGYVNAFLGVISSSAFDFNSSLTKFFRSVTIDGQIQQFPQRGDEYTATFGLFYKLNGVASTTTEAGVVAVTLNATPGVAYDINASGRSICIIVQLNANLGNSSFPIAQGPVLTRVAVKGVPIMPGYRKRHYALALFDDLPLKDGGREQNTPAQLRKLLEAMIQSNTPVAVYDSSMSNVNMVFLPDGCKIREIRPNEYVAYVDLREV